MFFHSKASIERNYQPQFIEQCSTGHCGPVILYTSLLVTLIYLGLTACVYFYYSRYVKRYTDQKLLVSALSPSLATGKVSNSEVFNFQLPPIHRTNQLNFDNRTSSLFHNNLSGTIRSLSSSTMSGYNPVFTQNFQTKAKQANQVTAKSRQDKSKSTVKEFESEEPSTSSKKLKTTDNYKLNLNYSNLNKGNKYKLDN